MTMFAQMQTDLDALYSLEEFAELITLAGVEVTAFVDTPAETSEQSLAIRNVSLSVSVRVSEVPSVVRGAVAVVRGITYRVLGDPQSDRLEWQLNLAQEMVSL